MHRQLLSKPIRPIPIGHLNRHTNRFCSLEALWTQARTAKQLLWRAYFT